MKRYVKRYLKRYLKSFFWMIPVILVLLSAGCETEPDPSGGEDPVPLEGEELTIFIFNDPHAQIDHFAKVQFIVEQERQEGDVILACAGDIFSGNPVVDFYAEKGYPIIDLMNKTGVDITVVGNHEFDYGQDALADRMSQSDFPWICANVDMGLTGIPEPSDYYTLSVGDLEVTFLGLLETNGKQDGTIPSTHPLKVEGVEFQRPEDVIGRFENLKDSLGSDLFIALTHLGYSYDFGALGDYQLAENHPYFDLIIGGHYGGLIDTTVNGIPVFQAGSYLRHLGKIELVVKDQQVEEYSYEQISLSSYIDLDEGIQSDIDGYNSSMAEVLDEVIGNAAIFHESSQLGCFYTDALREQLDVDVTFQNHGGIRAGIDAGDITVGEIYAMDPFNNGAMVYSMTVGEIKDFFIGSGEGLYYSGIEMEQSGSSVVIRNTEGAELDDAVILSVGINDYIPAVNDAWFPTDGEKKPYTTAEAIISYLRDINSEVNYSGCSRWFRYE